MRTIWEFHSVSEILPEPRVFDKHKWFDQELKRFNEIKDRANELNLAYAPYRHYSIGSVIPLLRLRSVIDFGGCFGSAFFSIDPNIRGNLKYQVYEREALVEFANSNLLDDLPYKIMSRSRMTADILYMNSVIQYMNDDLLKKILNDFSGSFFLIDDLYLCGNSSFIVKQNFHDESIFALIRKANVFFETMKTEGWSNVFVSEYPGYYFGVRSAPPMENLHVSFQVPLTRTVLFRRSPS